VIVATRRLDEAARRAWDAFVRGCPQAEFFHLSGWLSVVERVFGHHAHFLYAQNLMNKIEMASFYRTLSPEDLKQQKGRYEEGAVDALFEIDQSKFLTEAEKALETVVSKYGHVKYKRQPIGPAAQGLLYEIQHLAIGRVAPEIEGEDIDGVAFKLSDYRGKVVVLDFWGDW